MNRPPRVLVADDDENLRGMLRLLLLEDGVEVHEAGSGEDALAAFYADAPDLIALDVALGGRLDGFDVIHQLRRDSGRGMDVPVILLTGATGEESIVRGFEAGADDHVAKPFNPRELKARIRRLLARGESGRLRRLPETGKLLRGSDGRCYHLEDRISRGGMGIVYRGRDDDGAPVAIKVLDREQGDDAAVERFRAEVEALRGFDHPHLPRGIDGVIDPRLSFLVMRHIEGETLARRVGRGGALDAGACCALADQLLDALGYLHQRGLLHRDIKPENILIEACGRATLIDFGLTRPLVDSAPRLTTDGIILGTPYYLSPEQVKGSRLDIRSDLYSLGATLYHALSGRKPFDGHTTVGIINQRLFADPEPLDQVAGLDAALGRWIARLMHRDLQRRPATPAAARAELAAVAYDS